MRDSILLKLSLIISILGILALFFISESIKIENVKVSDLEKHKEDTIKIQGIVEQVTKTESATFLKIKQPALVTVVVFEPLDLSKGDIVEVTGKVDEYGNEYEVLADKIMIR